LPPAVSRQLPAAVHPAGGGSPAAVPDRVPVPRTHLRRLLTATPHTGRAAAPARALFSTVTTNVRVPARRDGGRCRSGCLLPALLHVDTGHVLELRPNCECCDRDLDPASPDVLICTYECTWCRNCAENVLHGVCPNCGGELVRRPIRPARLLAADPPSTRRVIRPGCAPASAR